MIGCYRSKTICGVSVLSLYKNGEKHPNARMLLSSIFTINLSYLTKHTVLKWTDYVDLFRSCLMRNTVHSCYCSSGVAWRCAKAVVPILMLRFDVWRCCLRQSHPIAFSASPHSAPNFLLLLDSKILLVLWFWQQRNIPWPGFVSTLSAETCRTWQNTRERSEWEWRGCPDARTLSTLALAFWLAFSSRVQFTMRGKVGVTVALTLLLTLSAYLGTTFLDEL